MTAPCAECARWQFFTGRSDVQCRRCKRAEIERARVAQLATERRWYEGHAHCGRCGNPGTYCTCSKSDPCGCADLHPVSSGLEPDALDAFRVGGSVTVSDSQEELF